MKRFFILCLFYVLVIINPINAQKKVLDTPLKFKDPKEESNLALTNNETTIAEPWTVFSDKYGNVSYTQPNAGTIMKNLGFLDLFYVVGVSGEWLNIYKGELNENGTLHSNAQDYGWIKSENLLLWKKCLKKNEISRKAMLLNTFEGLKSTEIVKGQGGIVKFYKDPTLTILSDKESNLFEIYFIYKQTATSYLLAKDERIFSIESPQSNIYGWVSKSKVTPWDHRVALIPNTNDYAIAERKSKNIRARIFTDQVSADKSKENKPVNEEFIIWNSDEYKTSYPGTYMRFPVLSSSEDIENHNSILKILTLGQITSKKNINKSTDFIKTDELKTKFDLEKKIKRSINLVFVIDGKKSVVPYYSSIINVVKKLSMDTSLSSKVLSFSAIVYHHFDNGSRNFDIFQTDVDFKKFESFLLNLKTNSLKKDNKARDFISSGLMAAMNALNIKNGESNLVFVIGDDGNQVLKDENNYIHEKLNKDLSEKNSHILFLQTKNSNDIYSKSFIENSKQIMIGYQNKLYSKIKTLTVKLNSDIQLPELVYENSNRISVKNNILFSQTIFPEPNKSLNLAIFENEITNSVSALSKYSDNISIKSNEVVSNGQSVSQVIEETKKDLFSKQEEATSKYVSSYAPAFLSQIADLEGMTDEKIDFLCDERYPLSSIGYANVIAKDLSYPLFEPVLFMTSQDLNNMIKVMTSLVDASRNDDRRKELKDTWIELLKKHMGNENISEIENLTMEKINFKIFGLPYTSEMLKGLKLKDIEEKYILDDFKLGKWIEMISRKIKILSKMQNISDDNKSFISNDQRYFWIEQNLLP